MGRRKHRLSNMLNGADPEFGEAVARESGGLVLDRPLPEGKVSEAICRYAEPLLARFEHADEDGEVVLASASVFWNAALIRQVDAQQYRESESTLMDMLARDPFALGPADAMNLIAYMTQRWDEEFSWCRRIVTDQKTQRPGGNLHLSVASIPLGLGPGKPAEDDGATISADGT